MLELKKFATKAYTANGSYDQDFSGRTLDGVNLAFDGDTTGTTTAGAKGAYRALGTPELNQAGEPLIRMRGVDWGYLAAYLNGGFPTYQTVTTASDSAAWATARVKFSRMVPGAFVNANVIKCSMRGTFGALTDFGTGTSAFSGNIRPLAEAVESGPPSGGFLRPRISQRNVSVASADANQQTVINVESDLVYSGIMLSCFDASATDEVDGLVKNIKVEITSSGRGTLEIINASWGQLRDYSCDRAGLNSTDVTNTAGTVLVPLTDRRNARMGGALLIPGGSSITITLDSNSTVEARYANVAPASGDLCVVTSLAFTPVAGTGDGAVQLTSNGATGRRAARQPRRTRRTRRRG